MTSENKNYKHADYKIRQQDPYAQAKYQIVEKWLPVKDNLRILNAGCGSGELTIFLSKNKTWKLDAIDVDPKAIAISRQQISQFGRKNVKIFLSSIEKYSSKTDYDVIVCNDVLEHVENDVELLKKLYKLLIKDGILIISVPAGQYLFGYHDEMLGHYRRYSKNEIMNKMSKLFRVEACRYFGLTLIPIAMWYSLIRRVDYPIGGKNQNNVITTILDLILSFEKKINPPLGTSILAKLSRKI